MMKLAEVRKMSKPSLVMKIMRDSTQVQKNKMLRLVLKRMPKAMLVRLCVMVAKRNLPKLKLTTKKGDLRKTSRKAFTKKRKAKAKTKTKKRKLRAGTITKIKIKMPNGKTRMQKVKVLSSGKYRFMKN